MIIKRGSHYLKGKKLQEGIFFLHIKYFQSGERIKHKYKTENYEKVIILLYSLFLILVVTG